MKEEAEKVRKQKIEFEEELEEAGEGLEGFLRGVAMVWVGC